MVKTKTNTIESFGNPCREKNKDSYLLNKVICESSVVFDPPETVFVAYVTPKGTIDVLKFVDAYSIDYWLEDDYFEVQTYEEGTIIYNQILKCDVIDVHK